MKGVLTKDRFKFCPLINTRFKHKCTFCKIWTPTKIQPCWCSLVFWCFWQALSFSHFPYFIIKMAAQQNVIAKSLIYCHVITLYHSQAHSMWRLFHREVLKYCGHRGQWHTARKEEKQCPENKSSLRPTAGRHNPSSLLQCSVGFYRTVDTPLQILDS